MPTRWIDDTNCEKSQTLEKETFEALISSKVFSLWHIQRGFRQPLRDAVRVRVAVRVEEITAREQNLLRRMCKRKDRVVETAAEREPTFGARIPFRHTRCVRKTGAREQPANVESACRIGDE